MNTYLQKLPEEIEMIIYQMAHEMQFAETVKEIKQICYFCNEWGSALHYYDNSWGKSAFHGKTVVYESDEYGPSDNRYLILP